MMNILLDIFMYLAYQTWLLGEKSGRFYPYDRWLSLHKDIDDAEIYK